MDTPRLIFDFPRDGQPERLVLTDPAAVLVAHTVAEVRAVLVAVEQALASGATVAGFLAYEAAAAFDAAFIVRPAAALPLAWFAVFRGDAAAAPEPGDFQVGPWESTVDRAEYDAAIAAIRAAIGAGLVYQVNYTVRLRASFRGDALALYERLRAAQRPQYAAFLDLGRWQIASVSPELFVERRGDQLTTRPMKGTVARGRWPAEDDERAAWLQASTKNRAENIMIVDLLRNDLGRLAVPGTVAVPALFALEQYPNVWQLTSTVSATLPPQTDLAAVLVALFPCGSITGAPKIAALAQIAALESTPRGAYCGVIGLLTPTQQTFSVAIRTLTVDRDAGCAEYGAGGGITWDSDAGAEYDELVAKAAILTAAPPAFDLLETLRLASGEYDLLDEHLARLAASARYLGWLYDKSTVRAALSAHAARWPGSERRVRLVLNARGAVSVTSNVLAPLPPGRTVVLAAEPVDPADRWLYHKTTDRQRYDEHRSAAAAAFDVLLWNIHSEITEFTIGNVVVELHGQRWTPPLGCGVLPGTLRAALLAEGAIHERPITVAEAQSAARIWLINSVRGWVEVTLGAGGDQACRTSAVCYASAVKRGDR